VRILALDTATENCSAALFINGNLLGRERLLERGHAQFILPMIRELLDEAGIGLGSLAAIAFGRGPGGFTGLRLAASVTQGLAFGAGVPVVPVSNLRALAERALREDPALGRVLCCTDARMHQVYCGAFERSPGGARASGAEAVLAPAQITLPSAWGQGPKAAGVGSGFRAYPELELGLKGRLGPVQPDLWSRAREMALLAVAEVEGGRALPADAAIPVYVRDDVAQAPRASH